MSVRESHKVVMDAKRRQVEARGCQRLVELGKGEIMDRVSREIDLSEGPAHLRPGAQQNQEVAVGQLFDRGRGSQRRVVVVVPDQISGRIDGNDFKLIRSPLIKPHEFDSRRWCTSRRRSYRQARDAAGRRGSGRKCVVAVTCLLTVGKTDERAHVVGRVLLHARNQYCRFPAALRRRLGRGLKPIAGIGSEFNGDLRIRCRRDCVLRYQSIAGCRDGPVGH